jgi:hypothetical protein
LSNTCEWLPPLVLFEQYGGNWEDYINVVYSYFKKDFIDSKPLFLDKQVELKRHPLYQDKECTFWHITSEGEVEAERTPDIRRCERIRWPRPIIDNCECQHVRWWRNKRKKEPRVVIWFYEEDYVVVLAERKSYLLLWTAYFVSKDHTRRKLLKEYLNSQKG